MGFVDFLEANLQSARSATESLRFGYPTDRITVGALARSAAGSSDSLAARTSQLIADSSAVIKIVRYPSTELGLFRSLVSPEHILLPGGALVYWEYATWKDEMMPATDAGTERLSPDQKRTLQPQVASVISDSFAGYVNHYAVNPLISEGVVVDGYLEWARDSISDPNNQVFVVTADGHTVVGAAVVSVTDNVWEVELASISLAAQRQGFYLRLMRRILSEANRERVSRVVISTQSHNVAVQRAWAKLGLVPTLSIDTVHAVDCTVLVDRLQIPERH